MPKKVLIHPNQRIDLPDWTRAANGYTADVASVAVDRQILDARPLALDGFRIRVPDQTLEPGVVYIKNGNAFDREGKLLNDEDTVDEEKQVTCTGASTTFYIEIEYVESQSDVDARVFWDPTVANTSPIPDGEEFSDNVTTRLTPSWRPVNPPSTTGFAVVTNPNSNRVPIAAVDTNGSNEIDLTGITLVQPSTVTLRENDTPTILHVADARLFSSVTGENEVTLTTPDTPAIPTSTIIRNVVSVDKVNNRLTLNSSPGAVLAGTRVQATGLTADLLSERVRALRTASSVVYDNVERVFQGDTEAGAGLIVDKEDPTLRNDLNVRSLKNYVDFMAGQLRDLRWGHPHPQITSYAPPSSFSGYDKLHYTHSGGIAGARFAHISVGDGVNSWGDFNGNDETELQQAFDALQGVGGVIHIKKGTYTINSPIVISESTSIKYEILLDPTTTLTTPLDHTDPVFDFQGPVSIYIKGSNRFTSLIGHGGAASSSTILNQKAIDLDEDVASFSIQSCAIVGSVLMPSTANLVLYSEIDCEHIDLNLTGVSTSASDTPLIGNSTPSDIRQVYLQNTKFQLVGGLDSSIVRFNDVDSLNVSNCELSMGGNTLPFRIDNIASNLSIKNNTLVMSNSTQGCGFLKASRVLNGVISDLTVDTGGNTLTYGATTSAFIDIASFLNFSVKDVGFANSSGVLGFHDRFFHFATTAADPVTVHHNLTIDNVTLNLGGSAFTAITTGTINNIYNLSLKDCVIENMASGVSFHVPGRLSIKDCTIDGQLSSSAQRGVVCGSQAGAGTRQIIQIDDSEIRNLQSTTAGKICGVLVNAATGEIDLHVKNLTISDLGNSGTTSTSLCAGIYLDSLNDYKNVIVKDCSIKGLKAAPTSTIIGVGVVGQFDSATKPFVSVCSNNISDLGQVGDSGSACYGVRLTSSDSGTNIVSNVKIEDNQISDLNTPNNTNTAISVRADTVLSTSVEGNVITNVLGSTPISESGGIIDIGTSGSFISVRRNTMNQSLTARGGAGIQFISNLDTDVFSHVTVEGNKIHGANALNTNGLVHGVHLVGVIGSTSATTFNQTVIESNTVELNQTDYTIVSSGVRVNNIQGLGVSVCRNIVNETAFNQGRQGVFVSGPIIGGEKKLVLVKVDGNTDVSILIATSESGVAEGNVIRPSAGAVSMDIVSSVNTLAMGNVLGNSAETGGVNGHDRTDRVVAIAGTPTQVSDTQAAGADNHYLNIV